VGLADPQAIVVVEACAAALRAVGLPEGLYLPRPEPAPLSAGAEKATACWLSNAIQTVRCRPASRPFPPTCATPIANGQAFGEWPGLPLPPMPTASTGSPQTYLPAPLARASVFLAARGSPGLGRGHRARPAATARRPTWPQKPKAAREQIEDPSAAARPDPSAAALAATPRPSLRERLDRLRQPVLAGGQLATHEQVLLLGTRSLLWALAPPRRHPEGAWWIHRGPRLGSRQRPEGQVQIGSNASPTASFWR